MKLVKLLFLSFIIIVNQSIFAQLNFVFSYKIGPTATFAKTLQTQNMSWGYATPPFPHMGIQKLNFGMGTKKNNLSLADHPAPSISIKYLQYLTWSSNDR